ncbi:hypothetical protein BGP77_04530 [Saccharospirillum sp. MSK14-1]|uniref:fluoride efflux transporter CrcB n=1 Tax=Saccharospirillum sp. MSK14-1 TaxID=1897632 RepID=UPI000D33E619|nr:fluoride efflux transporter CrcB [Saccharospirillum sp. MSK14-1]PTY36567.1 hypothetical protein BGP77_04530 [Saccharospirillum sp. MSK14-1]
MLGWAHWLAVAVGGGLGAMGRFAVVQLVNRHNGGHFPWGTLAANVTGSFIIGIAFVFFALKHTDPSGVGRSLVVVGMLGAFTTFSSFAIESLVLIEQQHYVSATLYVLGSVLACLAAATLGLGVAKLLF